MSIDRITTEQRMVAKEVEAFIRRWLKTEGPNRHKNVVEVRIQDDRGGEGGFIVTKTFEAV